MRVANYPPVAIGALPLRERLECGKSFRNLNELFGHGTISESQVKKMVPEVQIGEYKRQR